MQHSYSEIVKSVTTVKQYLIHLMPKYFKGIDKARKIISSANYPASFDMLVSVETKRKMDKTISD